MEVGRKRRETVAMMMERKAEVASVTVGKERKNGVRWRKTHRYCLSA